MGISKNFRRSEFKCRCGHCDFDTVDTELVVVLQALRDHFNAPVKITSGNRCPEYNNLVGGSRNSQHIKGRASDIQVKDVSPVIVQDYLKKTYSGRFGIGSYALFTHIDTRTTMGRWDG